MWDGAVEARRFHNPEIIGSIPIPATKFKETHGIKQPKRREPA